MQPAARQRRIVSMLETQGTLRVADLAEALGVSENTIRNDLESLAEQGLIERMHGGATIPRAVIPAQLRPQGQRLSPKAPYIIEYAVSWVQNGDSLIIGSSTLCVMLAERLAHHSHLRVVTPSLAVAYILVQEPSNTVVLAGGELGGATLATSGSMTQTAVRNFRADKAFFSCTGVSEQEGLTDVSAEAAELKRLIKDAADATFVLIESDRVGKRDLFPVGGLAETRRIVTDDGLDPAAAAALAEEGASVAICWADGHKTYRGGRDRKLRIGFANLSDRIWFSAEVRRSLERAAQKEAGRVELLIADNQTNYSVAVHNAELFVQQDVDLLIEYDGTGRATRPIRRLMRTADIPVIAVDIPVTGATHFGCDHDAAGITAGHALVQWVTSHWGGQIDELLLVNNEGGGTMDSNGNVRLEDWVDEGFLAGLTPAIRFHAALDVLQSELPAMPEVRKLTLPGDWAGSTEAVVTLSTALQEIVAAAQEGRRIAALCLVGEGALAFAQTVRNTQSQGEFAVIGFGCVCPEMDVEMSRPDTCLVGMVDLHAERYGEGLLQTALGLLGGEAIRPAVFVDHEFVSRDAVLAHSSTADGGSES